VLTLIVIFLATSLFHATDYPPATKQLIYFAAPALVFSTTMNSFRRIVETMFHAHLKMQYIALTTVIDRVLFLGFVYYLIFQSSTLTGFVLARVACSLPGFLVLLYVYRKLYGKIRFSFDRQEWKNLLTMCLPVFAGTAFQLIYLQIGGVLIKYFLNDYMLGIYRVAIKIPEAFGMVPVALMAPMLPILSERFLHSHDKYVRTYRTALRYIVSILVLFTVITMVYAEPCLRLFGEEYVLDGIGVFRIALLAQVLGGVVTAFSGVIISSDNQRLGWKITTLVGVTNLMLNILLIPRFGIYAAAGVSVLSNGLFIVVGMLFHPLRYYSRVALQSLLKPTCAGLVTGAVLYHFDMSLLPGCITGVGLYGIVLFLLGGVQRSDIDAFRELLPTWFAR